MMVWVRRDGRWAVARKRAELLSTAIDLAYLTHKQTGLRVCVTDDVDEFDQINFYMSHELLMSTGDKVWS